MKLLSQLEIDFYKCPNTEEARLLLEECKLDDVLVSIHDLQGKYVDVSSSSEILLGYTKQELIGNSAYDYFHPQDFQNILTTHAKVTIRPEVERVEYRLRKADNEYLEVYTMSRQLKGSSGEDGILALTVKRT
jgi:PAS domain S-box-containing protein